MMNNKLINRNIFFLSIFLFYHVYEVIGKTAIIVYAIRMSKQWNKYNALLAAGMIFMFAGIMILVFMFSPLSFGMYIVRPLLILLVGSIILYRVLIGTRYGFFVFIGMFLCATGLLFLFIDARIIPFTLLQIWPILGILSGLFLLISSFIRHKRLKISYAVPGIAITGFGVLALLFSLNLITTSFVEFANTWWPLLFIFFGGALIILFVYKKYQQQGDIAQNEDEDIS